MKLRYTPRALAELEAVLDYIDQRSPRGADRVKRRVLKLSEFIRERPNSGRTTSEQGLRRVVATPFPYLVFYEVKDDEVVGVRHSARDPRTMPGADEA